MALSTATRTVENQGTFTFSPRLNLIYEKIFRQSFKNCKTFLLFGIKLN